MKSLRTKSISIVFFIMMLPVICGCAPEKTVTDITDSGIVIYNTDDSTDPLNYITYVNKEINAIMNTLSSHIGNGENLIHGRYVLNDEIENVKTSLNSINEAIEFVEGLNPPDGYSDDRESILRCMANAEETLKEYQQVLELHETTGIPDCIDLMQGDYTALSGVFSLA